MINKLIEQIGGRERLEAFSAGHYCSVFECRNMASALLSVLDAKPYAYEFVTSGKKQVILSRTLPPVDMDEVIKLYRIPPATSAPDRNQLRELVDMVWNEATESETVPSTADADRIIDKVFHGIVQEHASSRYQSAAPAASAHDGWKLVPVEPTAKMMVAGTLVSEFQEDPAGMYRAMIAAAPSPGGDGG